MLSPDIDTTNYAAGTWTIDPVHSDVAFVVRHLMISKVRGHFTDFEGTITTTDDPLESSVTATIRTTSIDTANEQRDAHVRSADFLDVDEYPTMTYRSTGIRQNGDEFLLDGELTLKGITKPVTLKLEVNGFSAEDPMGAGEGRAGFSASGEINRTDFGVNFNGPIPGGVALSEKVQILMEIQAFRNSPAQ